jgi:nucleoside-diphosphate-sugar epimerase
MQEYEDANVKGTVRVARLAAEQGVKTLVYLSSLSVYARPVGRSPYLDETAAYEDRAADRGVYTQSKLAAERALLEYVAGHSSPRIIVIRAATIYGPGSKLPIGRFQLPSSARHPIIAGGRSVPMPIVYVDNLIDAMLAAANSSVDTGSVYNIVDSPELEQGELRRVVCDVTQGHVRPILAPYPVVWLMMFGVDLVSLLRRGRLGTARFRLNRTLANMRFKCVAAREDLKWTARVPLRDALAHTVESSPDIPHPVDARS